MGKKHQRDREEKREKHAARQKRESSKNKMIAIGVFSVVAAIIGYAAFEFSTLTENTPGGPPNAGALGSAHVHAGIVMNVFGDSFEFHLPAYQVKTPWIHFEGGNGDTIHRHATGVTLAYLFDSLSVGMTEECIEFPDGRQFCTDDKYSLKFYVNGEKVQDISDYVVQDDDRILISYGSETPEEIRGQLQRVNSIILDVR